MKKYCKENVLEAAMNRLEYIFDTFFPMCTFRSVAEKTVVL